MSRTVAKAFAFFQLDSLKAQNEEGRLDNNRDLAVNLITIKI